MRQPDEDVWVMAVVACLRDELGAAAYETAAAEGGRLELADAVARALALSAR
jgi:hypothetical protein